MQIGNQNTQNLTFNVYMYYKDFNNYLCKTYGVNNKDSVLKYYKRNNNIGNINTNNITVNVKLYDGIVTYR